MRLLLVHGGLYEGMTAERFWRATGVVASLEALGHEIVAPDRLLRPSSWAEEGLHLAGTLEGAFDAVVAGSNGCSAAIRLILDHNVEATLALCWPATRSPDADAVARRAMAAANVGVEVQDALLGGGTLRGIADDELRAMRNPVIVIPSEPENPLHTRATAETLAALLPVAELRRGFREAPDPLFAPQCGAFVAEVAAAIAVHVRHEPPGRVLAARCRPRRT